MGERSISSRPGSEVAVSPGRCAACACPGALCPPLLHLPFSGSRAAGCTPRPLVPQGWTVDQQACLPLGTPVPPDLRGPRWLVCAVQREQGGLDAEDEGGVGSSCLQQRFYCLLSLERSGQQSPEEGLLRKM